MKHHRALSTVIVLLLLSLAACSLPWQQAASPPPMPQAGVPEARLARLARCVDITRWFWEVGDTSPQHFTSYLGDSELDFIRRLGFSCVRLSIDPNLIYYKATPGVPDPVMLGYVDGAVKRIQAHDLAVIIDLHDDPEKLLEKDPDYARGFETFWRALAHHYSGWNADMLFLEVLNEPVFEYAPRQWLPVQQRLISAMRASAPKLTLIATGPLWSSVAGLQVVKPVADRNVIYTFHFYEPATFTHQGAVWWVNGLDRYMADLPFPSTSSQCPVAVEKLTNADVRQSALQYCAEQWDTAKIDGLVAQAAQWSHTNNVPIMAGEFGVYCERAPSADRLRWFRTVGAAFQRHSIGWNLWGYDDCYGLGRQVDTRGHLSIDWGVVQALGLNADARNHLPTQL